MTNRELLNIIQEMGKKGGPGITEIASKAGLNRSHFSTFINLDQVKPVTKAMLNKLRQAYPAYFPETNKNNGAGKAEESAPIPKMETLLVQLMTKQNHLMEMQNQILSETRENLVKKLDEVHTNSSTTLNLVEGIARKVRVDDGVLMRSNNRIEGLPVGTLETEADNLEQGIAEVPLQTDKTHHNVLGKKSKKKT